MKNAVRLRKMWHVGTKCMPTCLIMTIANFLESIPHIDKFNSIPIPKPDIQIELERSNNSPAEAFVEALYYERLEQQEGKFNHKSAKVVPDEAATSTYLTL
jgi:hypothetical protein